MAYLGALQGMMGSLQPYGAPPNNVYANDQSWSSLQPYGGNGFNAGTLRGYNGAPPQQLPAGGVQRPWGALAPVNTIGPVAFNGLGDNNNVSAAPAWGYPTAANPYPGQMMPPTGSPWQNITPSTSVGLGDALRGFTGGYVPGATMQPLTAPQPTQEQTPAATDTSNDQPGMARRVPEPQFRGEASY